MKFKQSRDLAKYLGVHEASIRNWRLMGMPFSLGEKTNYEYDLEEVLRWLYRSGHKRRALVEALPKRLARRGREDNE